MARNIKLLALFNFFTDFKLYSAVLVIYFARVTGSYALAMTLFSITMASAALFEVPTGIFSDMIGRRKTVIFGASSAVIYSLFYASSTNFFLLAIGAAFEGLSRAWYSGNNNALLYDSLESSGRKETYSLYLGKTSTMFQLALAIAATLGSVLANWSFSAIMWLSVIPQFCCLVVSFSLKEPAKLSPETGNIYSHLKESFLLLTKNNMLRLVGAQDVISFGINEATFIFRSAFIASVWPLWAVGISQTLAYVGAMISFWTSGRVIKKIGEPAALFFPRMYGRVIGIISYAFPTVLSPLFLSSTSLFYGTVTVATDSLIQKELTEKQRATVTSLVSLIGSIFFAFFSVVLGIIADRTHPSTALLMAEFISISALYFTRKIYVLSRKKI